MMTMLHSVWSGGESAAGRLRSSLALGALVALVASVLIWVAPGAQAVDQGANGSDPIAVPVVTKSGYDSTATPPTWTITLNAEQSFDPEDAAVTGGGITAIAWKALKPYDWLTLSGEGKATSRATEITTSVTKAQRDLFGSTVEFELTVTDDDNPAASGTRKASIELSDDPTTPPATGKAPTASVTVSAMQKDPAIKTDKLADYTVDAVISSSSDEWHVKESSLLVLDASGSTDPDTDNSKLTYTWTLIYPSAVGDTGLQASGTKAKLSTDDPATTTATETLANIAAGDSPLLAIYRLVVSDGSNSDTQVVRIQIVDQPATPRVTGITSADAAAQTATSSVAGYDFVISPTGLNDGMALTAAVADGDGSSGLTVTWSGAATGTGTDVTLDPATDAKEGDEYTVTATVTDPTKRSSSKTIKILAMTNTAPTVTFASNSVTVAEDGANGGLPVRTPPTGRVVLSGTGSDVDASQGPLIYSWKQLDTADCTDAYTPTTADPSKVLSGADTPSVSFANPEISDGANDTLHFGLTATDKYGVSGCSPITVTITSTDDSPKANAGKDRTVSSGDFVRLDASGSSDPDGDPRGSSGSLFYRWDFVGIETTPRTENRSPISAAEKQQGFDFGMWFPYNANDDTNTEQGVAQAIGGYSPDAGGKFIEQNGASAAWHNATAGGNRYPYFTAPALTGFDSVKLTFRLWVFDASSSDLTDTDRWDSDDVTITVESSSKVDADSKFYSGLTITGPSFCANLSVGGPALVAADVKWNSTGEEYPPDVLARDKDNIADTCVLPTTRRATVATQNVLHQLANLYPTAFSNELHKTGGPCATALATVEAAKAVLEAHGTVAMDSADALAADSCGNGRKQVSSNAIPAPADLGLFYSGAIVGGPWDGAPINGPDACTNFGLGGGVGGTWVYAADMKDNETGEAYPMGTGTSARDGMADSCVLPFTLREAVARQKALDIFKGATYTALYGELMKQECRKLTGFPSDKPYDLATDACTQTPTGTPLPSGS